VARARRSPSHVLGIFTSPAAAKWAEKLQLDLPIIQTVSKVQQTIVILTQCVCFSAARFFLAGHTGANKRSRGNIGSFVTPVCTRASACVICPAADLC